jgi:hypothetical protein
MNMVVAMAIGVVMVVVVVVVVMLVMLMAMVVMLMVMVVVVAFNVGGVDCAVMHLTISAFCSVICCVTHSKLAFVAGSLRPNSALRTKGCILRDL